MFTTRPELIGTFGVVGSTHWLATAVGMSVLEKGGNAFDAAVAAGFALQIVEPHLNGPGGEVPLIIHDARQDETEVICGQGPAPAGATLDHYTGLGLDVVPGTGLLAAVVPGAFGAWMLLLRDRGTMPLRDVLAPAIALARDGFAVVPNITATINEVAELFRDEWTGSADLYLPDGAPPAAGTLFRNPVLADTYERILREAEAAAGDRDGQIEAARRAFYEGFIAEAIGRYCAEREMMDSSGERHGGVLTADDMAGWRATVEAPLTYDYDAGGHTYTVCKTGPWGQGPVFLQQLALLSGFGIDAMDPAGADFVHTVVECAKLAFADREAFYGDPDFVDVPLDVLLSDDYNAPRRDLVGAKASLEMRPGTIEGFGGKLILRDIDDDDPAMSAAMGTGEPTIAKLGETRGDTCHLDVIDRDGNMVSATPSGGWLQSSPVVPELGFCLSNRAQMFWLEDGLPATLAPDKRPRTTLTPSFALRDGAPYMAFGTPGGDQQDQWSLTFFLRHVHFGLNLQEAIDAPAFHSAHFPSSFYPRGWKPGHLNVEGRFDDVAINELEKRGHIVTVENDWSLGRLSAATRDDGVLKVAANARGMQGYAAGR